MAWGRKSLFQRQQLLDPDIPAGGSDTWRMGVKLKIVMRNTDLKHFPTRKRFLIQFILGFDIRDSCRSFALALFFA